MENVVKFVVTLIYFILTFVAPPLADGGPYAEGAAAKFTFDELLYSNSPERGAADELIVGINRTEKTLYVLAHGSADGGFWLADSAKPVVDTLIDGLVNSKRIKTNDIRVVVLVCCYPGCQQPTTAAIGVPVIPFTDVKAPIKTLVTEGQIVAVY